MKKILGAVTLAGAMVLAGQASATELWEPHLPGSDEGLAAGALPPPGVYGVLDNYLANYYAYTPSASKAPSTGLTALVEVPIVLWSTGIKVFGADYAVAIAQPFDYTSIGLGYGLPNGGGNGGSGNWGTYNTVLVPGQLAWTFGDFHVKTGLTVYVADASSTVAQIATQQWTKGGLPSGNGYWAVQPDLGLSWLHDGWNLSASLHLPIPVSSTTTTDYSYHSGTMFEADYTATKTLGKWTLGLGAYQVNQLNSDSCSGSNCVNWAPGYVVGGGTNVHHIASRYALGPIVGYQFGGINMQLTLNESVYVRNTVGGLFANLRFIVPF